MNITPEVFDKKCPHCGVTIEKQLKTQAFETGYGYREHGVFMCNFCEGDIEFRFEWGVVWSEITKVEEQLPDRSAAPTTPEDTLANQFEKDYYGGPLQIGPDGEEDNQGDAR